MFRTQSGELLFEYLARDFTVSSPLFKWPFSLLVLQILTLFISVLYVTERGELYVYFEVGYVFNYGCKLKFKRACK